MIPVRWPNPYPPADARRQLSVLATYRDRRRDTGDTLTVEAPKLPVEILPTSLHGHNPRTVMGKPSWERHRRLTCDAASNRCEICGGVGKRHPVEVHERYEYDETSQPPCQRLVGLIALCPDCHAVKHWARTRQVSRERGDLSIYEHALA